MLEWRQCGFAVKFPDIEKGTVMQHLHTTAPVFYAVMALYTLVLVGLIAFVARGMRSSKAKYLLADRNVGLVMGSVSISCAWAWAPAQVALTSRARSISSRGLESRGVLGRTQLCDRLTRS